MSFGRTLYLIIFVMVSFFTITNPYPEVYLADGESICHVLKKWALRAIALKCEIPSGVF